MSDVHWWSVAVVCRWGRGAKDRSYPTNVNTEAIIAGLYSNKIQARALQSVPFAPPEEQVRNVPKESAPYVGGPPPS